MANKNAAKTILEDKKPQRHKVTSGAYKSKNEAINALNEANKKGFTVALAVIGTEFTVLFGEYDTQEEATTAAAAAQQAGLEVQAL